MSEARAEPFEGRLDRLEGRLDRVEADIGEIKTTLRELVPVIHRIDAQIPYLATKAELADLRTEVHDDIAALRVELRTGLADKPSRLYLWAVLAALFAAQAVALGGAALIFALLAHAPPAAQAAVLPAALAAE